jgi:glycyl-tRNA synthetase beta chain
MDFVADRLTVHLREINIRHDLVAAALGKRAAYDRDNDLVRLLSRINALRTFLDSEDGRNLLIAYRRASNIVGIEERKDGRRYHDRPNSDMLEAPAEIALFRALGVAQREMNNAIAAEDFTCAMAELARLRRPIDSFFAAVMVNVPEPELRENRLLLLNQIRSALDRVADFSLVEDAGPASA